jgi:ABC-2 type transport system ATP-binding protein
MDIHIANLRKSFGEKVAVNIGDLTIRQGEMLGLVGNNGAGKTTLFRLMLDLMQADQGEVAIGDINPAQSEEWKQHVGAYIDDGFLIDFLTPEEYFDFIGRVGNLGQDDIRERLELYKRFMAGEILDQRKLIRDFSAGNKQKIGIIAALLTQPQIVILDEPFNFLDPSSQNILKKMLISYSQQHGATVIVSSHNLQHTVEISTRITLLENGNIISDLDNTDRKAEEELERYFNVE